MNSRLRICAIAATVLAACSAEQRTSMSSSAPSGIRYLAPGDDNDDEQFLKAADARAFRFPADHGSHPGFRTEWWYFTGNLLTEESGQYGFQLTFFRYALNARQEDSESAWRSNQIWMAHLAVTDVSAGAFFAEERLSREALGLAGARQDGFEVWVEDWRAAETAQGDLRLTASGESIGIDLQLRPTKPVVLQGDAGLDAKGPEDGNASYYYSWPRIDVDGEVTASGNTREVTGQAWLDREWGTSALSPGVVGWSWFALQLADGRDLMIYRLRNADGSANPFSSARMIESDGDSRELDVSAMVFESTRRWHSERSGTDYPVGWRIEIPEESLTLTISPVLDDQEVLLSVQYWEGAVVIDAQSGGEKLAGRGYLELAGYQ